MYNSYVSELKYVIGDDNVANDTNNNSTNSCNDKNSVDNKVTNKTIFFADDSLIILSSICHEKLIEKGNLELERTSKYMNANQLILNKGKTQYSL